MVLAQRVIVQTRNGPLLGVTGSKPPHILSADERNKVVEMKDVFVDIGDGAGACGGDGRPAG